MLGIVAAVLVIGVLLALAGVVLLSNLFGAGDYVIRVVTSRYLGSLPPGYAASKRGFRVYAILVLAVGLVCVGFGLTGRLLPIGAGLIVIGAVTFGIASVAAITGEVETSRRGRSGR
jgi:membrane protease YdiL (CAAX protease family)